MRINSKYGYLLQKAFLKPGEKKEIGAPADSKRGERLEASQLTEMLRRVVQENEKAGSAQAEKLASLAEKLKKGEYRLNAQEIAAAMLSREDDEDDF